MQLFVVLESRQMVSGTKGLGKRWFGSDFIDFHVWHAPRKAPKQPSKVTVSLQLVQSTSVPTNCRRSDWDTCCVFHNPALQWWRLLKRWLKGHLWVDKKAPNRRLFVYLGRNPQHFAIFSVFRKRLEIIQHILNIYWEFRTIKRTSRTLRDSLDLDILFMWAICLSYIDREKCFSRCRLIG